MVGSPAIATWIALAGFGVLLVCGLVLRELTARNAALFVIVWLAGRIVMAYAPYEAARGMVSSFTAVLDIVLVFMIFKGDVTLRS